MEQIFVKEPQEFSLALLANKNWKFPYTYTRLYLKYCVKAFATQSYLKWNPVKLRWS